MDRNKQMRDWVARNTYRINNLARNHGWISMQFDTSRRMVEMGAERRGPKHKKPKVRHHSAFKDIALLGIAIVLVMLVCSFFPMQDDVTLYDMNSSTNLTRGSQATLLSGYQAAKRATKQEEEYISEIQQDIDISQVSIDVQSDVLNALQADGISESKAYGLLACYVAMKEVGFTDFECLGLMACAMHEGTPGLIQHGYPSTRALPLSDDTIWKSSGRNPLIVDSSAKANTLLSMETAFPDMPMGVGTAQWTYGRCYNYIRLIKSMYGDSFSNLTIEQLYACDKEMYTRDLGPGGSYAGLLSNIKSHESSLEALVVYELAYYEAGFGYYQMLRNTGVDPDKIESWENCYYLRNSNGKDISGAIRTIGAGARNRLASAERLRAIFLNLSYA